MLPIRWKIFKAFNYLYIAGNIGIIFRTISLNRLDFSNDSFFLFLLIIAFLTLVCNSTINLVMIEKNYPDKMAGELRKVSNVFLVVTGAILAAIILFVFLVFFQNINSLKNFSREDFKVNLLGLISMIAFPSVGIYIF